MSHYSTGGQWLPYRAHDTVKTSFLTHLRVVLLFKTHHLKQYAMEQDYGKDYFPSPSHLSGGGVIKPLDPQKINHTQIGF